MATRTPDGRIRVPVDLDAVTAIGDEDHSEVDGAAAERIWQAARHWYRAGLPPRDPVMHPAARPRGAQPRDRARLGQRPYR